MLAAIFMAVAFGYTAGSIDGTTWRELGEESRWALVVGYNSGLQAANDRLAPIQMSALPVPGSRLAAILSKRESKFQEALAEYSLPGGALEGAKLSEYTTEVLQAGSITASVGDFVEAVDEVYSDPANRPIKVSVMLRIVNGHFRGTLDKDEALKQARACAQEGANAFLCGHGL